MKLVGKAYKDEKTKDLLLRLPTNAIAVIKHADIDEVSAAALIRHGPKAIVNFAPSSTGKFPNVGPRRLLEARISYMTFVLPPRSCLKRSRRGSC